MKRYLSLTAAVLGAGILVLSGVSRASDVPQAAAAPAGFEVSQYRLGPGDKVRLIVFGQDNLGGEFSVSAAGILSLPLIGDLPAAGRTLSDVQSDITAKLADGYINDPKVSLEVINFRPFYILGEVNKPGEYPYAAGLTVLNAVAEAGGFTYRANEHRVYIRSDKQTDEAAYDLTPQMTVAPGDTIRIRERHF